MKLNIKDFVFVTAAHGHIINMTLSTTIDKNTRYQFTLYIKKYCPPPPPGSEPKPPLIRTDQLWTHTTATPRVVDNPFGGTRDRCPQNYPSFSHGTCRVNALPTRVVMLLKGRARRPRNRKDKACACMCVDYEHILAIYKKRIHIYVYKYVLTHTHLAVTKDTNYRRPV